MQGSPRTIPRWHVYMHVWLCSIHSLLEATRALQLKNHAQHKAYLRMRNVVIIVHLWKNRGILETRNALYKKFLYAGQGEKNTCMKLDDLRRHDNSYDNVERFGVRPKRSPQVGWVIPVSFAKEVMAKYYHLLREAVPGLQLKPVTSLEEETNFPLSGKIVEEITNPVPSSREEGCPLKAMEVPQRHTINACSRRRG